MKILCFLILSLILTGCVTTNNDYQESRTECITVSERFNINKKLPDSNEFKRSLEERYKGFYRVVNNEIWMYSENSRLEFVWTIYGKSGEMIGMKDKDGKDLTVKDLVRLGPSTNLYDTTAERLIVFQGERTRHLEEQKRLGVSGSTAFVAEGKPEYCKK
jgi:hypothetical protein